MAVKGTFIDLNISRKTIENRERDFFFVNSRLIFTNGLRNLSSALAQKIALSQTSFSLTTGMVAQVQFMLDAPIICNNMVCI